MLKYRVRLRWNGTPVVDGAFSAVMASTVLQSMLQQFSRPVVEGSLPSLQDLHEGALLITTGQISDVGPTTGEATFVVERIKVGE